MWEALGVTLGLGQRLCLDLAIPRTSPLMTIYFGFRISRDFASLDQVSKAL